MFPRKHIPPDVKLFDTMNARSNCFPRKKWLPRRRRFTAAPQTQARKCGIDPVVEQRLKRSNPASHFERPPPERCVLAQADSAVYEREFPSGPTHGLDSLLRKTSLAVKHRHVRLIATFGRGWKSCCVESLAQRPLKRCQRDDTIVPQQDQRLAAPVARKTCHSIKRDIETRHRHSGCRGTCHCDDVLRQTRIIAEEIERDMELAGCERSAVYAIFGAQLISKLLDARGRLGIREDREEQAIGEGSARFRDHVT